MGTTYYCSFCGKAAHEVITLIAGPTVFICDECVDVCIPIVAQKRLEHELAKRGSRLMQADDIGI